MSLRDACLTGITALLLAGAALGDLLILKDGRRIEGTITAQDATKVKIQTSFGEFEFPRADVERIEKGKTAAQEFEERFLAARSAADFFAAGQWAEERKLRSEAKRAMKRVLELEPGHAGANLFFGKVQYKGEWLTPAERDARAAQDAEAEMLAKGFVRWKEQWVTPEERAHLEQNEVLVEGKWIPFVDAQRRKGLEEFQGQWLPRAEAIARGDEARVEELLKLPLAKVVGADHLLAGNFDEPLLAGISTGLQKGREWFDATYQAPAGLESFGGRLAELYVWKKSEPYAATIAHFGSLTQSIPPNWGDAVQKAFGFVWWDPYPLSSARQWGRSDADIAGHCYHHWGHLLVNRLNYDGRLLPPWYEEGLASLLEFRTHGVNLVFCRGELVEKPLPGDGTGGGGKGPAPETKVRTKAGPPPKVDPKGMRGGAWKDTLRGMGEIPPFDELASRQFNELSLSDIAAAMAIVEWLEGHGPGTLQRFHAELRKAAPPAPNRVLPNSHLRGACYDQAFQAAVKLSWKDADSAWRAWFRSR